jgi:hypothetical protein
VREAQTPEELKIRLRGVGVDTELDPVRTGRDNREKLIGALGRLENIRLAWALQTTSAWESRRDEELQSLADRVEESAYFRVWSEVDVWALVQKIPPDQRQESFWSAVSIADGLDSLVIVLALESDAINRASKQLEALRESALRKKRVEDVCGKPFDNTDGNLSSLWSHICANAPQESVVSLSEFDITKPIPLDDVKGSKSAKRMNEEAFKRESNRSRSKSTEGLIGLCGEIHAFRMLQAKYGSPVVTASAWKSSYSAWVFKDNRIFDDCGCDFVVSVEGRTFYIEVKSSEGEQDRFTMGSSEISLAKNLSRKSRKKQRETFVVLRVLNALTASPVFQILPNPYDAKYQGKFDIEDADARIRFNPRRSGRR